MTYDLAIVGAGIVGLGHALAAAKRGKRVVVIDRDARANGASVRNFGFVTVTGQGAGDCWRLARRARDIWQEIAPAAGIDIVQRGLVLAARLPESEAVVDAFLATEMGEDCRKLTAAQAQGFVPCLRLEAARVALYSPHEIRVESRTAVPLVARYLAGRHGVVFRRSTSVVAVEAPRLVTAEGEVIEADAIIVCPGDDYTALFPERIEAYGVTRCKLQMMRVKPARPVDLRTAVMSDLGLARYLGYAALPEAEPLRRRLDAEMTVHRQNGIHLIVTQSADGSLVIGDSHHYATTPDPFAVEAVDDLILDEFDAVLDLPGRAISERWIGTYASAKDWRFTDRPSDAVRIVIVTAGCGASTAFGIGEETIDDLFGRQG